MVGFWELCLPASVGAAVHHSGVYETARVATQTNGPADLGTSVAVTEDQRGRAPFCVQRKTQYMSHMHFSVKKKKKREKNNTFGSYVQRFYFWEFNHLGLKKYF